MRVGLCLCLAGAQLTLDTHKWLLNKFKNKQAFLGDGEFVQLQSLKDEMIIK